jgi:hypothetical protein
MIRASAGAGRTRVAPRPAVFSRCEILRLTARREACGREERRHAMIVLSAHVVPPTLKAHLVANCGGRDAA